MLELEAVLLIGISSDSKKLSVDEGDVFMVFFWLEAGQEVLMLVGDKSFVFSYLAEIAGGGIVVALFA